MQYWEPSSRAFVDMLDSYAHLPFLGHTLAQPSGLLEPANLSILLHEYVHLLSLQGPISLFNAYQTSMIHALQGLCLLKATHEPKDLHFFTVNNFHHYTDVPPETIATSAFLEQYSENLRFFVNFSNAYRWVFEGLSLFIQWDYTPHPALPPSSVARFVDSLLRAQPQHPETTWFDLLKIFNSVQDNEREKRRKWALYQSYQIRNKDYFVGYLTIKRLWHLLGGRDNRLRSPEIFLRFALTILLHDWGILTLCTPTKEPDVFSQDDIIKSRIQAFQANAIRQVEKMDSSYLSEWVDRLIGVPDRLFEDLGFIYISSPEHETVFFIEEGAWEPQMLKRLESDIQFHVVSLFKSTATRDRLRQEFESITASASELFNLIRRHHTFFKLYRSSGTFIGYQEAGQLVRQHIFFPDGFSAIQNISPEQVPHLLQELRDSGPSHIKYPWDGIDLFQPGTLNEQALGRAVKYVEEKPSPLSIKIYDLYDIKSDQLVQVQVVGGQVIVGLRSPSPRIMREEEIRTIAPHLDRASYWERLKVYMAVFPDGNDYFYNYLMVDGWHASSPDFLSHLLRGAWRTFFANSSIDDKELDLLWERRIPTLIARSSTALRLCESLCSERKLGIAPSDSATIQAVETINKRWSVRVGTPLIATENVDESLKLTWLY